MTPRMIIAAAMSTMVAACAIGRDEDARTANAHPIEPYGIHEECATLAPGDRVEYSFTTDAPVSFDIHYHDGAAVVEPITRQHVTQDSSLFEPLLARDYCLMWEAGAGGAHLDYRMRVRRAPR